MIPVGISGSCDDLVEAVDGGVVLADGKVGASNVDDHVRACELLFLKKTLGRIDVGHSFIKLAQYTQTVGALDQRHSVMRPHAADLRPGLQFACPVSHLFQRVGVTLPSTDLVRKIPHKLPPHRRSQIVPAQKTYQKKKKKKKDKDVPVEGFAW